MANKSARQLIEDMPQVFRPQRARGASAVIQFELSGLYLGVVEKIVYQGQQGFRFLEDDVALLPRVLQRFIDYVALGKTDDSV